jgi:hypothetical protein
MARKYQPLAPVGTPGIWTYVANMVPTRCGSYYPANVFISVATPALASPGTTNRAWCALYGNDSVVGYVGTSTKLYTYDGATTFADVSRGGNYTSTSRAWQFCQFGNITLASNRVDAVQYRDASAGGLFADLAAAPKANVLVTQSSQVLAFDINIGGTEYRNAFATCAPGDYTDWSGANATTNTPITHRPGKITAAVAFRDYVLVFKQSSVYKLTYTGSSTYKWRVECIAIGKGAWAPFDVVNTGESIIFSGPGGVWKFDGATFTNITEYVGEFPYALSSWFCPLSQNVFIDTGNGSTNATYVYNLTSDRWGVAGKTTTSSGTSGVLTLNLVPAPMLMGEPAAMRALISPTTALPDLNYAFESDLSSGSGSVWKSSSYWGTGGSLTIGGTYICTGAEGIGGRAETAFTGADMEWTVSITRAADIGPAAGTLSCYLFTADTRESYSLVTVNTGSAADSATSSTSQNRFDFKKTAPYAKLMFTPAYNSGYIEILDAHFWDNSKPRGRL